MLRVIDLRGRLASGERLDYTAVVPRAAFDVAAALEVVRPICDDVGSRGTAALQDYSERFDHVVPDSFRVPADALASAVRRTGPVAVFLWAQMPGYGDRRLFERLPALRPATRIVLGGPGWRGTEVPDGVTYVDDLAAAVERLSETVLA